MQHERAGLAAGTGDERDLRWHVGVEEVILSVWVNRERFLITELREQRIVWSIADLPDRYPC
jgi:hypothetical protein